jgi:hypothetical protein
MNFRTGLRKFALAAAGVGAFVTQALAAPIPLPTGPITFAFTDLEQISPTGTMLSPGGTPESNWGIASINTIREATISVPNTTMQLNPIGDNFFTASASSQITAIFYGLQLAAIPTPQTLQSSGGFLDVYWDEPGLAGGGTLLNIVTQTPAGRTADDQFTGFTDGIFLARLAFASGIDATNPNVTISGTCGGFPTTVSGTCSAEGYLNIVVGATNYAGATGAWDKGANQGLDQEWFEFAPITGLPLAFGPRDLRFRNTFSAQPNWGGIDGSQNPILGANSSDPVDAFVPEPGILALTALGLLLGGGFVRTGRNRAA